MIQPTPPLGARSERDRRVYFEQLTQSLLAKGMEGDRIGELVAELDEHMSSVGGEPVAELGPVGDLSQALVEATAETRPWAWLIVNLVFGLAVGLAATGILALTPIAETDGTRVLPVGIAIYVGVFTFAMMLADATRENRLVGRSPSMRAAALWRTLVFLPVLVLWNIFVGYAEVPISALAAVGLVLLAAPVAIMAVVWIRRWSRVEVPGRARHLHRLDLGWWSR